MVDNDRILSVCALVGSLAFCHTTLISGEGEGVVINIVFICLSLQVIHL